MYGRLWAVKIRAVISICYPSRHKRSVWVSIPLHQLRLALLEAASTLAGFFDKKGDVRRTYFTLFGERRASRSLDELRKWQGDFESIIDLIDKKRRLVPNSLLLDRDRLRTIHRADGQDYVAIPGSSHSIAECEYSNNGIQDVKVLIEQKVMPDDVNHDELEAVASILASRLCTNTARQGILRCLGYRRKQNFELVFELPKGLQDVQTLGVAIADSQASVYGGYPLQDRVTLCRELCEAVLCVHTSGLVHKNIRPDTVLLVRKASDLIHGLGSAYLTDWFMLRKVTELSSRRGSSSWTEDLYRHPRRQGRQPEERYNMGHDLYSLGVLLIEISLWETFVQPSRNPPVSGTYVARALDLNLIRAGESSNIDKLTMPLVTYKVMVSLAERELAPRMGTSFATFVLTCLKCLEGNIDGLKEQDIKNNSTMAALKFRELVVQTFGTMPVA